MPLKGWIFASSIVVCCAGIGLCDRLVTRTEEFYRVHRACACVSNDIETPKTRCLDPIRAVTP